MLSLKYSNWSSLSGHGFQFGVYETAISIVSLHYGSEDRVEPTMENKDIKSH